MRNVFRVCEPCELAESHQAERKRFCTRPSGRISGPDLPLDRDVGYAAHNGLRPNITPCPLCVSGSEQAYSITSSASAETEGEMVSPIAFAVFKLITNLKWVGPSIGNSPGALPRKINATKCATRRCNSEISGP
jgi:hypothetical protein